LFVRTSERGDTLTCTSLGLIDYDSAYALQEVLVAQRASDECGDVLLLLEHPPVLTLGRRGERTDIYLTDEQLVEQGILVRSTNRGGLVTYHGPGQIVGYLIAMLASIAGTAPAFVNGLEEAVIRTLAGCGIEGMRHAPHRGVFVADGKIAAIGVGVRRGVTMHGFALNVQPDMRHFGFLNPCGLEEFGVSSVDRVLGTTLDLAEVQRALAFHLGRVFDRRVEWVAPGDVLARTVISA
jgi:lipoate-protein ligase B